MSNAYYPMKLTDFCMKYDKINIINTELLKKLVIYETGKHENNKNY